MAHAPPPLPGEFLGVSQLKERGWTRALIATFLGQPDYTSRCATGGRPAGLYLSRRVLDVEATGAFSRAVSAARGKAESAQAAASDRRLDLLRYASLIELPAPVLAYDDLVERARATEDTSLLRIDRDRSIRSRALSLALESFAEADSRLDIYQRSAGIREARLRLLERKLALVADCYPALAPLCRDMLPGGLSHRDIKKAA